MIKTWEQLDPGRRGWALGSLIGLFTITFYLGFYIELRGRFFFNLICTPALPGILFADSLAPFLIQLIPDEENLTGHMIAMALGGLFNYAFWGGYGSLLFRSTSPPPKFDKNIAGFSGFSFFLSISGISYTLSRGVVLDEFSSTVYLLLASFLLFLISSALLYSSILALLAPGER